MKGAGKGGWSEMTVFFGGRFIDCSPVVERFGEMGCGEGGGFGELLFGKGRKIGCRMLIRGYESRK